MTMRLVEWKRADPENLPVEDVPTNILVRGAYIPTVGSLNDGVWGTLTQRYKSKTVQTVWTRLPDDRQVTHWCEIPLPGKELLAEIVEAE